MKDTRINATLRISSNIYDERKRELILVEVGLT